MKIIITAGELIDRGLWPKVCELMDIGEYAVNEGQLGIDHRFVFTETQAAELELIPPPKRS